MGPRVPDHQRLPDKLSPSQPMKGAVNHSSATLHPLVIAWHATIQVTKVQLVQVPISRSFKARVKSPYRNRPAELVARNSPRLVASDGFLEAPCFGDGLPSSRESFSVPQYQWTLPAIEFTPRKATNYRGTCGCVCVHVLV